MRPLHKQQGYSLIDLILYTAFIALIVLVVVQFMLSVLILRNKTAAERAAWENGRYAMERIVHQLRSANQIDLSTATFGTTLDTLALLTNLYDIDEPEVLVTFFVDGNGQLIFSREGYTSEVITTPDVRITQMTLTRFFAGTSEGVKIALITEASSPSTRFDFQATYSLDTSILIRKK